MSRYVLARRLTNQKMYCIFLPQNQAFSGLAGRRISGKPNWSKRRKVVKIPEKVPLSIGAFKSWISLRNKKLSPKTGFRFLLSPIVAEFMPSLLPRAVTSYSRGFRMPGCVLRGVSIWKRCRWQFARELWFVLEESNFWREKGHSKGDRCICNSRHWWSWSFEIIPALSF